MAVGVIVPAAGRGSRLGSAENKIWLEVGGRSLLAWSLEAFHGHPSIDCIVVAGAEHELDRLRDASSAYDKVAAVVAGGSTRAESVWRGLIALPAVCDTVLVHDAARPAQVGRWPRRPSA